MTNEQSKRNYVKELKGKFYQGVEEEEIFLTQLKIAIDHETLTWKRKDIVARDELSQQCTKVVLMTHFKGRSVQFAKFKACLTDAGSLGAYSQVLRGYIILVDNRVSEVIETGLLGHLIGSYKNLFSKAMKSCIETERQYNLEVHANTSGHWVGSINLNNLVTAGLII